MSAHGNADSHSLDAADMAAPNGDLGNGTPSPKEESAQGQVNEAVRVNEDAPTMGVNGVKPTPKSSTSATPFSPPDFPSPTLRSPNDPITTPHSKDPENIPSSPSSMALSHLSDPSDGDKSDGDKKSPPQEPTPTKPSRTPSQKDVQRQIFDHLPDSTQDALATFEQIDTSWYANKYMGQTEHAMECDCAEEWDPESQKNLACGEDSDCINRATKIECVGDCACGPDCQNQRFQKKQYAKVSVIKTEKKGFGLRTETDLDPHQLIYEYVGEVVGEAQFRRRMVKYDEEGIKHFYFMSLNKGEFVDATKRGNLGRFCNHSCNPNCYVDKWVVGEKLRMGIFAERSIQAGEELVFNYNVDRYGADPQVCHCDEPNCVGFIGGRTQTERATKLSHATIEALGIDDDFDSWDTAVARRPKKRKTGENDEEYVDSVGAKNLDENGVTKVMAALMQCQEKWIAVKLLSRIQRCEDERTRNRVVKMHGYQILNSQLSHWKDDHNVVLQILDILDQFPRLTRNKIIDSNIESNVQPLTTCGEERVEKKAADLLATWATLEVAYRIPRMKKGDQAKQAVSHFERRESGRERPQRSVTRSPSPVEPQVPKPQKPKGRFQGRWGPYKTASPHEPQKADEKNKKKSKYLVGARREPGTNLPRGFWEDDPTYQAPKGWYTSFHPDGRVEWFTQSGLFTFERPTEPPPSHAERDAIVAEAIQEAIDKEEKRLAEKRKTTSPATPQVTEGKPKKTEPWEKLPLEKQKKVYQNTIHPIIKPIVDRFHHRIPKDHLKRFAKEISLKVVDSDYKNDRVTDPTKVSAKQQAKIKSYCEAYFAKAAAKFKEKEEGDGTLKRKREGEV
ncbi:hypothetical protein N7532_007386 [Penicillium argentinense]|uniref:Histone-lysine N-methyltransferase, H3 lysine-36 specific n=1 Tax=Penicillium argentinense TaxID=1131581 RepID=A0A9W9F7T9_9EURO|nr:uncharacterized protein N7532_007386 [Penicillium argentinense]KAJ5095095.1 hypothetical protein N7532_007386 [Penicillium argentinense]